MIIFKKLDFIKSKNLYSLKVIMKKMNKQAKDLEKNIWKTHEWWRISSIIYKICLEGTQPCNEK